jgi:hypothetical protein
VGSLEESDDMLIFVSEVVAESCLSDWLLGCDMM